MGLALTQLVAGQREGLWEGEVNLNSQAISEALVALNAISRQVDNIALEVARLKRTEDIACSMGEVTAVVASLSTMAQDLQSLVNRFTFENGR